MNMWRSKIRFLLVLFVTVSEALVPEAAIADVIRLKNGNVLNGDVESTSEQEVIISIPGMGRMTLKKDEIISIEKSSGAEMGERPSTTSPTPERLADQGLVWERLAEQIMPLIRQHQYAEAAKAAEEAYKIAKAIFDRDDPKFLISVDSLASVYRLQGRFSEAQPLYQEALAIAQEGQQHYEAASILHALGELYELSGQDAAAKESLQSALMTAEDAIGSDHASIAAHLHSLGKLYLRQRRYADAQPLYERSIAIYEDMGPNHPDLDELYKEYAELLTASGDAQRAKAVVADRSEHLRSYAAKEDEWRRLNGQVQALAKVGKIAEATDVAKKALAFAEEHLRPRSPLRGTSLDNLALLYFAQVDRPFYGYRHEVNRR